MASIHPLHAVLLAGAFPLFLGVLFNDIAYAFTYEVQWKNFASWLIVGGLVFGGLALLFAALRLFRPAGRGPAALVYLLLLLGAFVLGFVNALVHAKDVWAAMPASLILSSIVAVLITAAVAIGFSGLRRGARA